jgi:hypothetical protein
MYLLDAGNRGWPRLLAIGVPKAQEELTDFLDAGKPQV